MPVVISGTNGVSGVDGTASNPSYEGTDSNTGIFFPAADTVAIATGGTQRLTVNSSGNTQTVGTISVGNATPSTSGAGITFPATQSASSDANTLDDYDEGTWTPTATSASGSLTAYTSSGIYTKIGRTVFVRATISLTTVGTASGALNGGGLPFTAENTNRPFVSLVREDAATGNGYLAAGTANSTTFFIHTLSGNAGIVWTNGYVYTFCATYQV
jgi:hypothetical protein